ncbi:YcxB family protein [Dactylosporangium vinaceum]|uniref:YcxB family protein n=1 Tax=Dactylosporangium vinaceum TaxID=53362 RepID=A0ABV5LZF0_9ACTN|nr:YcxB family protein [Dactylosporangium vinaceum]UAB92580.1 YcxB family protein [Dactylosporangium vinaceum]
MQIRFDVPADPAYPARVAAVMSSEKLRRYRNIGAALVGLGVIGLVVTRYASWGALIQPLSLAMVVGGALSVLYGPWVRYNSKRRSGRYAVEGAYDITADNIMMTSGSESGGIAWDGVSRVAQTPDFWVVYVGRIPATVIPREYMSEPDAAQLERFLHERGLLGV